MIKLYEGDCLEIMSIKVKSGSVDLILADLPYGTTNCKWDSIIPMTWNVDGVELDDFLRERYIHGVSYDKAIKEFNERKTFGLWQEYERVLKPNGAIILTACQPFTSKLVMSNPKMFKYSLVYQKTTPTGHFNSKKMPLRAHEDILVFYKKPPTYNPQKTFGHKRKVSSAKSRRKSEERAFDRDTVYNNGVLDSILDYDSTERYPLSVLKFSTDKQKSKLHPTQKPLALMEYIIKTYTNEGYLVLDNAMGSGTTGEACDNLNRNFIGIEKLKVHFNTAKNRILNK